jgi:hypothetical protein
LNVAVGRVLKESTSGNEQNQTWVKETIKIGSMLMDKVTKFYAFLTEK